MNPAVADYHLLGPLGDDADTWLAEPPSRLGEPGPVAVTRLATTVPWPVLAERLRAVASVPSEHLVPLLEAGAAAGEGPAWVSRAGGGDRVVDGPADPRRVLRACAGAARGLHDLHEAGLAHGELVAASVLLDGERGRLVPPLRRWGLDAPTVAVAARAEDVDGMEPAALWGTGASRATDLWALGAAVHRLLSGRLVHPGADGQPVVAAVQQVLGGHPVVADGLPEGAAAVVRECLSPAPEDRPASALEVAERLEEVAG